MGIGSDLFHASSVIEQTADRFRDGSGVAEWNQHSFSIPQEFLRVPVGGRDHGFSRSEDIREGSGGDLGLVKVRRDVDIGRGDESLEILLRDKPVVEDHVFLHPPLLGEEFQTQAVTLPLPGQQMGVRGTEHQVDHAGMAACDFREGLDHMLDSLARTDQAEREKHPSSLHPELRLTPPRIAQLQVRDAVRDDVDFSLMKAVSLLQDLDPLARHHHHAVASLQQFLHDLPLGPVRFAQDRVQRGDNRHPHLAEKSQKMASGRASVDPELMLDAKQVGVVEVQEIGAAPVGIEILLQEFEADAGRVVVPLGAVVHRPDIAFGVGGGGGHRFAEILREGRDPAMSRRIVA